MLVVGGSCGIGQCLRLSLSKGKEVFWTSRHLKEVEEKEKCLFLDLEHAQSFDSFVESVKCIINELECCVFMAAFAGDPEEDDHFEWAKKCLTVNYVNTVALAKKLLDAFPTARFIFATTRRADSKILFAKKFLSFKFEAPQDIDVVYEDYLRTCRDELWHAEGFSPNAYLMSKCFLSIYVNLLRRNEKKLNCCMACPGRTRTKMTKFDPEGKSVEEAVKVFTYLVDEKEYQEDLYTEEGKKCSSVMFLEFQSCDVASFKCQGKSDLRCCVCRKFFCSNCKKFCLECNKFSCHSHEAFKCCNMADDVTMRDLEAFYEEKLCKVEDILLLLGCFKKSNKEVLGAWRIRRNAVKKALRYYAQTNPKALCDNLATEVVWPYVTCVGANFPQLSQFRSSEEYLECLKTFQKSLVFPYLFIYSEDCGRMLDIARCIIEEDSDILEGVMYLAAAHKHGKALFACLKEKKLLRYSPDLFRYPSSLRKDACVWMHENGFTAWDILFPGPLEYVLENKLQDFDKVLNTLFSKKIGYDSLKVLVDIKGGEFILNELNEELEKMEKIEFSFKTLTV